MRSRVNHGFTLVELLVIVAIIVALLSLLAPAMDKAVYQAELTECGARLKGMSQAVLLYANDNKRRYVTDRSIRQTIVYAFGQNDLRRELAPYISVNRGLQCPMAPQVDLAGGGTWTTIAQDRVNNNPQGATVIYSSYALWIGWRFEGHEGMTKIGNRIGWTDVDPRSTGQGLEYRLDILITDLDQEMRGFKGIQGSHPDQGPNAHLAKSSHQNDGPEGVLDTTFGWWDGPSVRGWFDLNYGYQDGSVRRLSEVQEVDERRVTTWGHATASDQTGAEGALDLWDAVAKD